MQGFKVLVSWLTNGGKLPVDYQEDIYPMQLNKFWKVPRTLSNYDSQEMANILVPRYRFPDLNNYIIEINKVHKAIILASLSTQAEVPKLL